MDEQLGLSKEEQAAIINTQLHEWRKAQYDLIVQRRVIKKLKEDERLVQIEAGILRAENAIIELEAILKDAQ